MRFSVAHPNPGKRSTENFTKISRQMEKHFTSALLQGSCSEKFPEGGLNFLEVALVWIFPYGKFLKQSSKKFASEPPPQTSKKSPQKRFHAEACRRMVLSKSQNNRKGGTASLCSRTCVKRNAVFSARFKGLSLHFRYQKGHLIRIKAGLDTCLIRIQTRAPLSQ